MPDGSRLCMNCAKPVPGKAAQASADTLLDGMTLLFCRYGGWWARGRAGQGRTGSGRGCGRQDGWQGTEQGKNHACIALLCDACLLPGALSAAPLLSSPPPNRVLQLAAVCPPLLRSGECEGRFGLKSNGSAYRRALFKLERGVCVMCKLDCHTLVKRLQVSQRRRQRWCVGSSWA